MENVELVTNQNGGIAILLVNRRILEIRIRPKRRIRRTRAHPRLGIGADPLLEEVVLALHADALHEIKGIGRLEGLAVAELGQEAVGHKLNVVPHQAGVHADEVHGQGVAHKLLLQRHGFLDKFTHPGRRALGEGPKKERKKIYIYSSQQGAPGKGV